MAANFLQPAGTESVHYPGSQRYDAGGNMRTRRLAHDPHRAHLTAMEQANDTSYDGDLYAWTQEQAALLRRLPAADNRLDIELIAEEIEDLGKSELHTVQSLCEHIIEHLLKVEHSGLTEPAGHWRDEIVERRIQLARKSTRSVIAKLDLSARYRVALRLLRRLERDVPGLMQRVPAACPYSLDQILGAGDEDWFPAPRSPAA
jgi:Domain of unknown function DUF29